MARQKLNDRQRRFVEEYLVDLNATQAAIRAGYSEKTARVIGAENLTKPDIAAEIKKRQKAQIRRTEITQDFVLTELMKIAMANGSDFATLGKRNRVTFVPTDELPPEKRAAVAAIKKGKNGIEVKTYDKLRALELIGKHLGMFKENRQETDQTAIQSFLDATKPSAEVIGELYDEEP